MNDFVMKAGASVAKKQFKKEITNQFSSNSKINWKDLNYPPALKLIHYDINEVPEHQKKAMNLSHAFFGLQAALFLLNFFNAIVQLISGYSWTRPFASIFYYLIIVFVAGFAFFQVFQVFVGVKAAKILYKVAYGFHLFMTFFQIIFSTLSWNSLFRVIYIFGDGKIIAGFLALVEFLVILAQAGFLVFIVLEIMKVENDADGSQTAAKSGGAGMSKGTTVGGNKKAPIDSLEPSENDL